MKSRPGISKNRERFQGLKCGPGAASFKAFVWVGGAFSSIHPRRNGSGISFLSSPPKGRSSESALLQGSPEFSPIRFSRPELDYLFCQENCGCGIGFFLEYLREG